MEKNQNNKIGILGGSFDPAHTGHLAISKIAIKKVRLNKIYWVITKKNPFKKKPFFSLKKRLRRAKEIVKKNDKIQVLYLDNKIKSSRSIDMIKHISKKESLSNLYFIIGSDILYEFHRWKSWKKIVKLAKLIVFSRKGYDKKRKEFVVVKYLKKNNLTFIKNKPIEISSTILREKISKSN